MILSGDIGGTKTSLALYTTDGRRLILSTSASFPSGDYRGLKEVVSAFLMSPRPPIHAAGFGIAGPISGGRVKTTNLPWVVDGRELAAFLGIPSVRLLNDLEAMASGIEMLRPEDMVALQEGEADPEGNSAVIAAGTGLGEALLMRHEGRLRAYGTEGGHGDFAPGDGEADAFLFWLRGRLGHVSAERVVSGLGLRNMYDFFHDPAHGGSMPHLSGDLDVAAAMAREAAAGTCPGCGRAMGLFLRCYGAEAGNLALKSAATSGLYVGGGIAMKNAEAMADGRFLRAFRDKGRFTAYMERIPIRLILNPTTPLLGAALSAARAAGRLP